MPRLRALEYSDDSGWLIFCPACRCGHKFDRQRWAFNGDLERPTFTPSMLVRVGPWPDFHPRAGQVDVCHSFVTNGEIRYLGDSTHGWAFRTVSLEFFPESPPDGA